MSRPAGRRVGGRLSTTTYRRDGPTRLAYVATAAYAFVLYAMGPIATYLRVQYHLDYAVAGLYSTMWALGTIATGLSFDALGRRVGRRRLFWGSAVGFAAGIALLVVGPGAAPTLVAAAILGSSGTTLLSGASAILSDRHGPLRDRALVEANVGASATAVTAPALLGALQPTPGWRLALAIPAGVLALAWWAWRRAPVSERPAAAAATVPSGRLPASYWPSAILVGLVVGVEFCIVYFGSALVHTVDGLSTGAATTALSAFYLGELAGRATGALVIRRPGRAPGTTAAALVVTLAGLPVVWLVGTTAAAYAGLFVLGLGVANLYPVTIGMAVEAAAGRTDAGLARAQLLTGVAVALAPLALGALADSVGISEAFVVVPGLIGASLVLLAVVVRVTAAAEPR